MSDQPANEYILGIDLGSNSLGWAIIGLIDGEPAQLLGAGARVFEAGMEGDLESGREESRNLKRREARLHRRLLWRRRRRLTKLFNLLQRFGLLPPAPAAAISGDGHRAPLTPDQRQDLINELDQQILSSPWFQSKASSERFPEPKQTMPYILRAAALDEPLEPHSLGRAIYHLAQRRGFLSNRKQVAKKKDDDEGAVKEGIAELRKVMQETQARTLGEYFSHLDPSAERIRCRWTARDMYEKEFNAIWDAQTPHHPNLLNPERKKQIYNAIFYQRPLWFDPKTVGQCELEPGQRRAPRSSFLAQRFRLLQAVNNLRLELPDGSERSLTPEERGELAQGLEIKGNHTFAQVRKLLKVSKEARFTIESGGEKTLRGNTTTSKFYEVFGERWMEMSAAEHEQALHDVLSIQKEDVLQRRALNHWKLDEEAANKFARTSPEPDYFNLSRKAIEKLLPLLETGATYAEARHELYPEKFEARQPVDSLPRLAADETRQAVGEIRNPTVTRSLTELRKVVNSIVRSYGKPAQIRIELARDLKRSKQDRKKLTERNRDNEAAREKMKKKILEEAGLANPSGTDIRKALLHDECGGVCPYTGKPIDFRHLFGHETQFDIEHIIPYERCFDNSFSNLTLCYNHENRHVKGKKTPREAYQADEARYEEILDRVKRFHSPSARAKLWRFQMTETEATEFVSKFVSRQLNDTRYASKLAAKYIAMLYGGKSDEEHTMRVHVSSGEVTAQLRRSWLLNRILNDGPTAAGGEVAKTREDHRHHAVDAVAIALTDDATIQKLSRAAELARDHGQRKLGSLEAPWPNFVDSIRAEVDQIVVSHRVSKKVSGALHEETIYSRAFPVAASYARRGSTGDGTSPLQQNRRSQSGATAVRVRKPLAALTKNEVEDIADEGVRKLVEKKIEELGGAEPQKAFSNPENLPKFPSSGVVIKSVRITKPERPTVIGQGRAQRHVISGNNHHVEIYAEVDEHGNEGKWDGEVVSMAEAYQRLKAGKPIVQRNHGPLVRFKFSLAPGEVIECDDGQGGRALWVSRGVASYESGPRLLLVPINDARKKKDILKAGRFWSPFPNPLRRLNPRKVVVSPLGEVAEAHD